jgi:hypothetical protein
MRGPSTPLRGALLGLLLERPGHGGDLASRLATRLGETWRVDTGQLGMSPSTRHRYMTTLLAVGLPEQDPRTRRYRLPQEA